MGAGTRGALGDVGAPDGPPTAPAIPAEPFLAGVLDAIGSPVIVVDGQRGVVELNAAAAELTGCPVEAARGRALRTLLGCADEVDRDRLVDPLAAGEPGQHLLRHLHPAGGGTRWVRWTATGIVDPPGPIGHLVLTGTDVTADLAAHDQLVESGRRLRSLLDSVSDLVLCLDATGLLTHISSAVLPVLGYEPTEWLGKSAFELVHPDDLALVIENFEATVDLTADPSPMTLRVRTANGAWIPFEVFANNQLDEPDVAAVVVSMREVSERARHEAQLQASQDALRLAERQFRSSFDHAPIGMALVGLGGEFLRINDALCDLVGYSRNELLGRTFQDITHPEDLAADLQLLHELLLGERLGYQLDKRYLRPDGTEVWAQLNVTMVRNQQGNPMHFVAQIQDVTERRQLHAALVEQANHDVLTGLVNRACFEERLAAACAGARADEPVTVVFMDLDQFKAINDTFGHATGDLVLVEIANRVRRALRPDDVAARVGGDELAAILLGADESTADQAAERLRAAISEPMDVAGQQLCLSASIGHASTSSAVDSGLLLKQADVAMYADKRSRLTSG